MLNENLGNTMNSLFKKPSELTPKQAISAMIYGSPGSGKSTLACSVSNAVMLDYDGGVNRMNGAHRVPTLQITKWEETQDALAEIATTPEIKAIVVDTVGKMLAFIEDFIRRNTTYSRGGRAIDLNADGTLSLKGFGRRNTIFKEFLKQALTMGRNVIFVAHDREEKDGDETKVRADVGSTATANEIMRELDLVGYVEMIGNKRTILFTPCGRFYAKNTCNMPGVIDIPVVVDDKGNAVGENNFFDKVLERYNTRQQLDIETTSKYEELCELIESNANEITDAETANSYVEWVKGLEHIYNSKAKALTYLQQKVDALGLTFDKKTKTYA